MLDRLTSDIVLALRSIRAAPALPFAAVLTTSLAVAIMARPSSVKRTNPSKTNMTRMAALNASRSCAESCTPASFT